MANRSIQIATAVLALWGAVASGCNKKDIEDECARHFPVWADATACSVGALVAQENKGDLSKTDDECRKCFLSSEPCERVSGNNLESGLTPGQEAARRVEMYTACYYGAAAYEKYGRD